MRAESERCSSGRDKRQRLDLEASIGFCSFPPSSDATCSSATQDRDLQSTKLLHSS